MLDGFSLQEVGEGGACCCGTLGKSLAPHPALRMCPHLLQAGDRVLIAEACNHNRITEMCNDIGMVQVGTRGLWYGWGAGGP